MTHSHARTTRHRHPIPPASASRTPRRLPAPPVPEGHLDTLGRLLHGMLPAFTTRDRARGQRDCILPIATGLLRGREALREGPHGRLRGQRHLLTALLHAAHLAFDGDPPDRLTRLLALQRTRLARQDTGDRRPWLEAPPGHHYDRALTQTVDLAYELDRHGGPSPRRLQTQAADLANHVLYYLIQTGAIRPDAAATDSRSAPPPASPP